MGEPGNYLSKAMWSMMEHLHQLGLIEIELLQLVSAFCAAGRLELLKNASTMMSQSHSHPLADADTGPKDVVAKAGSVDQ